jgi:hypothetical protein
MNLKTLSADAPKGWEKDAIKQKTKSLQKEIAEWQHKLYAEEKKSLRTEFSDKTPSFSALRESLQKLR